MTQATQFSVPTTGPLSPDIMAGRIADNFVAALTGHSGASRPSYAQAGTIWQDTSLANIVRFYLYDGTVDRLLYTVNTATGAVTFPAHTAGGAVNMAGYAITNPAGEWLRGFITGLTLSNNVTDATNDIDVAAGSAASDGSTPVLMTLTSVLTKRLDAAWAVGSGSGGLDAGSIANGTYHVFLIQRSDTGVVDALYSASATSPTMPANYDRKRRIGSVIRAGGALLPFVQTGDFFDLSPSISTGNLSATTSAALFALTVPTGLKVRAKFSLSSARTGANVLYVSDPAKAHSVNDQVANGVDRAGAVIECITNASGQVNMSANASYLISVNTLGWTDIGR